MVQGSWVLVYLTGFVKQLVRYSTGVQAWRIEHLNKVGSAFMGSSLPYKIRKTTCPLHHRRTGAAELNIFKTYFLFYPNFLNT